MSYPWPSFGAGFLFQRDESPIFGTDLGWIRDPSFDRQRPLGSAADVVTALAIGSADRAFEVYLSPARFAVLEALLNTEAAFTDWERPTPDSRQAALVSVQAQETVAVLCSDGTTQKRIRTAIRLVGV